MEAWHIWIIAALLLFIVEIFTSGFAIVCLSIGALCGALASVFSEDFKIQLLCFAIGTLIAFMAVRPLLLKCFRKKKNDTPTNAEGLIGKTVTVCESIDTNDGGRVQIDGDNWKAVSEDGMPIEKGEKAVVTKIDSIVLTVKKLKQ